MSRAPTASIAPTRVVERPPAADWFEIEEQKSSGDIVLVTSDPMRDAVGIRAQYHQKRQYLHGKWEKSAAWVDAWNMRPLEPQPTHWRPDPQRGRLEVPVP
jgi:hypothetical protein